MCIVRGNVFDERPRCGVVDVIPGNEVDVDGVFVFGELTFWLELW